MRYIFRKYIFAHTIYAILSCFRKINELKNVGNLIIEPRGSRGEYNYCFRKERSIISSFQTDLRTGEIAEELFMKCANTFGWTVQDVRDEREYQRRDIDFIVHVDGDPKPYSVDVKYAGVDGGADLIEIWSNREKCTLGWGYKSDADIIVYYKATLHQFHFLWMPSIREFLVNEDIKKYRTKPSQTDSRSGKRLYGSETIRVPYEVLRKKDILYSEVSVREFLSIEEEENICSTYSQTPYVSYCTPSSSPTSYS